MVAMGCSRLTEPVGGLYDLSAEYKTWQLEPAVWHNVLYSSIVSDSCSDWKRAWLGGVEGKGVSNSSYRPFVKHIASSIAIHLVLVRMNTDVLLPWPKTFSEKQIKEANQPQTMKSRQTILQWHPAVILAEPNNLEQGALHTLTV